MPRLALLFVLSACWAAPSAAAGIDCSRAKSEIERKICADKNLLKDDYELSVLHAEKAGRLSGQKKQDFIAAQKAWLGRRDECVNAGDRADERPKRNLAVYTCLLKSLGRRIQELRAYPIKSSKQRPTKEALCGQIEAWRKSDALRRLAFQSDVGTDLDEVKREIGAEAFDRLKQEFRSGGWYVTAADLDNDGIADFLIQETQGTAHCVGAIVFKGKGPGTAELVETIHEDAQETGCNGGLDLSVLPVGEFNYLLVRKNAEVFVETIGASGLEPICRLGT